MQADNSDEYYDVSTRNKKYGRVNAMNGPLLLEKYVSPMWTAVLDTDEEHPRLTHSVQSPSKNEKFTTFSSKFGYH